MGLGPLWEELRMCHSDLSSGEEGPLGAQRPMPVMVQDLEPQLRAGLLYRSGREISALSYSPGDLPTPFPLQEPVNTQGDTGEPGSVI